MILAAIEGQLLILLLMALFGFISWLSGKLNPGGKQPPSQPPGSSGQAPRRAGADSEEERMRRFLEALGLPTTEPPPPSRAPVPPRPARPVVAAPPPIPAPSLRQPRPVAPPPPMPAARSLDELERSTFPVEKIALPDLVTSPVREFETVSSRVTAAREDRPLIRDTPAKPALTPVAELLRAALASPQQLRTAFVLREILGPPPGLRG